MAERRVEHIMGTAVTIEVRDRAFPPCAVESAFAWLRWVDATFSTYDSASEISRINTGALAPHDAHPLVRDVLARCEELRVATDGYFDLRAAGGRAIDPSGLVKGWAVDRAFTQLARAGVRQVCIEAGGDLRVGGGPWRVGVRHPFAPSRCAAVLVLADAAVATSGGYERGAHIVDPHTGEAASAALSVTIADRTLARADAYATAAVAMGRRGPAWTRPLAAMTILSDEEVLVTPAFAALRA